VEVIDKNQLKREHEARRQPKFMAIDKKENNCGHHDIVIIVPRLSESWQ